MTRPIISVDRLGKAYRLGASVPKRETLRDAIVRTLRAPLSSLRASLGRKPADLFWALRDISFEVSAGEVVGLIGRNGAGKSTLLKILSRVTEPTEGQAILRGRVASLLEVGTGFHPELTGRENIFLNGALLGMRRAEILRKFDAIVEFAEIERFLDVPVKRYSSGMYVRLAFAVGAHLEPEILFVDEVLAVGDSAFQRKCLGKMNEVVRQGRTILFVSHDMDAIVRLCSHVMVFDHGRVLDRLPPEEGVRRYLALGEEARNKPLADRARISSRPRPIFTRAIVASAGGHAHIVEVGEAARFELELSSCEDVRRAYCQLTIRNDRQQPVVSFDSRIHGGIEVRDVERARLVCEVASLPLLPGAYTVDLSLADDYEILESVEGALQFDVVFRDVLGTGLLPKPAGGSVVLPALWSER